VKANKQTEGSWWLLQEIRVEGHEPRPLERQIHEAHLMQVADLFEGRTFVDLESFLPLQRKVEGK